MSRLTSPAPSIFQSSNFASAAGDVHPMYGLIRRHGRLPAKDFVALVGTFRTGVSDDVISEQLLATYVPLLSAMVQRKSPKGDAGLQFREGAVPAAIAAFFEAIGDSSIPLAPRALLKEINSRVTRALEQELLSAEHALVVSAQSAWRAGNVIRTAGAVSNADVDWLTRDEVYAILGDSIRVESIHLVQNSKFALALGSSSGSRRAELGEEMVTAESIPNLREETTGAAAVAAERLARALATLPAADARMLVDAHGLFGRKPILAADVAAELDVHPSTYRRILNRAEALLRSELIAQDSPDLGGVDGTGGAPVRGAWCSANSSLMRKGYRTELEPGMVRYARHVAGAVRCFAEHEGWNPKETEAAVRRLVSFRTGRTDASDHPLTLQIVDSLTTFAQSSAGGTGRSAAEPPSVATVESSFAESAA